MILVAVLCAGLGVWFFLKPDSSRSALHSRELATRVLAEYLARTFPNEKLLVVSNPFTKKKGPRHVVLFEEAGVRGLQKGFGENKVTVAFPELQPGALENPHAIQIPAETTTPVAFLMAEGAFDALAQKYSDCKVMVSLIGLPPDLSKLQLWSRPDGPKLAFLLPDLWMLGDKQAVVAAFKTGKITAVVLNKPGVSLEQLGASVADFSQRYLLITPDNIEQTVANYPQLFE